MSILNNTKLEYSEIGFCSFCGVDLPNSTLLMPTIRIKQSTESGIEAHLIARDKLPPILAYKKDTRTIAKVEDCNPGNLVPIDVILPDKIGEVSISNIGQCHLLHQDIALAESTLAVLFALVKGLSLMSQKQQCAFKIKLYHIEEIRQPSEIQGRYHQAIYYACTELLQYFLCPYDFKKLDPTLVA